MNKKTLFFSAIVSIVGYILSGREFVTWCYQSIKCEPYLDFIAEPLGLSALVWGISFTIVISALLLVKNRVTKKWWKFARVYLPIALILILISGDGGGGLGVGFGGGYDREGMIWFTAGLFTLVSLVVIFRSWWKERKAKIYF